MTGNLFPARLRVTHQNRQLNTNYRRNGKLQSCEPCRKGKVRCDHMMPSCGRCTRRNKSEQCVYHPAPLTKSGNLPTPQSTDVELSSPSTSAVVQSTEGYQFPDSLPHAQRIGTTAQPRTSRASSLPAQPWSSLHYGQRTVEELRRPLPQAHLRADSLLLPQTGGFMHHAAVLAENEVSIGIIPSSTDAAPTSQVNISYVERGAAILTLLKDLPSMLRYIDKWFSFARGILIIEPMVKIFTNGINASWGRWLRDQSANDLRLMSEKIWENTLKPLPRLLNRHTTPRKFCASVTGEDLRWEVVGIVLTIVAMLTVSLSDGDPIFCSHDEPLVDRKALLLKCHNASEITVGFCDDFGVLNDLYLWLLYENAIVYSAMRTKGSYANWKKSGVLTTALVFCNLHEEIKVDDKTPFFITEFRKRLFAYAYAMDKYSSTYNGRPPRLTRKYCRVQLPLDLSDAQLMADGPDLDIALASLDDKGWNQRGAVQLCTSARICSAETAFMEEILEISMGFLPAGEIERRAEDIERRATASWDAIPDFLKADNQVFSDVKRAPIELLYLAEVHFGYLYLQFLLQRTLVKKVGADPTKLLATSCRMFNFIIIMINHREIFKDFHVDFVQMLNIYGIPSAAVVAVELLHQEQNPSSLGASTNPLPRSKTIQDLSVLVACLGTIQPWSCGYASCERGQRFLKKILDTILDPPQMRIVSDENMEGIADPTLLDPLFQAGNDGDFMRWLETMEWEQDGWTNFNSCT